MWTTLRNSKLVYFYTGNLSDFTPVLAVVIEYLDWHAFIERYDKTGTLFYIDPPYWGNENDYGKRMFGRAQFELLAAKLAKIKGKFLLSLNNRPEVRDVFKGFKFEEVRLTYSVAGGKGKLAKEVITSGLL